MVIFLLANAACFGMVRPTFGRPPYKSAFEGVYEKQYSKSTENWKSCTVCHLERTDGEKRQQNNYGKAFGKLLGGQKVNNKQAILKALADAENEPSDIPGMTFGDLINAGRLPASKY
jgi:hypothetical protein